MIHMQKCVSDVIKNLNVKVFNLTSRTNGTRHIKWQETCKCKYRLDASASNNKQRWNGDKCWCKCKELIDKGLCDRRYIWKPSNCECEWDKSCDVGEYLDNKNCNFIADKFLREIFSCTRTGAFFTYLELQTSIFSPWISP